MVISTLLPAWNIIQYYRHSVNYFNTGISSGRHTMSRQQPLSALLPRTINPPFYIPFFPDPMRHGGMPEGCSRHNRCVYPERTPGRNTGNAVFTQGNKMRLQGHRLRSPAR